MIGVKEAIQAAGASLLYLPSYSPDLNPIEQFFAKLKELPERPPPAPRRLSGRPSAGISTSSRPRSAKTTSLTADTSREFG